MPGQQRTGTVLRTGRGDEARMTWSELGQSQLDILKVIGPIDHCHRLWLGQLRQLLSATHPRLSMTILDVFQVLAVTRARGDLKQLNPRKLAERLASYRRHRLPLKVD